MDIIDMIAQAGQGQGLEGLARKFNLNPGQARAALDELAPAVMAGIRRETDNPGSLSGLLAALGGGNHGRYLQGNDAGIVDDGNAILGHIFGSKDVSRGVAAKAAESTGINADILKQMLPQVAAMVMGALGGSLGGTQGQRANAASQGDPLGGLLGQVLGGLTGGPQGGQSSSGDGGLGGLGGMLGGLLGGQGQASSGDSGLGGLLGNLLGAQAQPEVRDRAVKKLSGVVGSALGAGTPKAQAADQLLDSVGHLPKVKRPAAPARTEGSRSQSREQGPSGPRRGG